MVEQNYFEVTKTISNNATTEYVVDAARMMSMGNRKQYVQVDGQGNAQTYLIRLKQRSYDGSTNAELRTTVKTAPNNYVTKSAVKAWHRGRVRMLGRQGFSLKQLSPYARHLRMDWRTGSDSFTAPTTLDTALYGGQAPEDTEFVVASQLDSDDTAALTSAKMVDTYTLALMGNHVTSNSAGDPTQYTTVSATKAWLDARRLPMRNQADATSESSADLDHKQISHETNPLYEVLSGDNTAEELSEVVEDDQLVAPPWVNDDHYEPMTQGSLYTAVNSGTAECVFEAPLGLFVLDPDELRSGATATWSIEVLDVYDM